MERETKYLEMHPGSTVDKPWTIHDEVEKYKHIKI